LVIYFKKKKFVHIQSFHNSLIFFSFLVVILYLGVENPLTYNFVGSIIGLDEYDNSNKPDRDTLYIHYIFIML
jgi:hypothetical protein